MATPILKTTLKPDGHLVIEFDGLEALVVHPDEFPTEIVIRAAGYGIREKATNAASLGRDPKTGKAATPAEKREAVIRVLDAMRAGQWDVRGAGSSDDALLVEAIMEAAGVDRDAARAAVTGWDTATKKAMMVDPAVGPVFERLRKEAAARAAQGVDTSKLLAGLKK